MIIEIYSWDVLIIHCILAVSLFYIINWFGKNSSTYGYRGPLKFIFLKIILLLIIIFEFLYQNRSLLWFPVVSVEAQPARARGYHPSCSCQPLQLYISA